MPAKLSNWVKSLLGASRILQGLQRCFILPWCPLFSTLSSIFPLTLDNIGQLDLKTGQSWGLTAEPMDKEFAPRPGTQTANYRASGDLHHLKRLAIPREGLWDGFCPGYVRESRRREQREKTGRWPELCEGCEPHTVWGVGGLAGLSSCFERKEVLREARSTLGPPKCRCMPACAVVVTRSLREIWFNI